MSARRAWLVIACLLCGSCTGRSDDTVIRFWAMGREAEVVAQFLPEFEQANPGLRVDLQNIPWTSAHEKLLTAFAADALPDVCQLGNTWLPEFVALDALVPLQPLVDASQVIQQPDYFPGIWDTNVVDGVVFGVPWYVDTRLVFYRKDILARAGYTTPPTTWAQWQASMAAIKRQAEPGHFAVLLPLNEFEQQLSFALQQDDPLLRDHDGRGNFRSPGFRRALAFYAGLFADGYAPPMSETQISNVWDEFFNGLYAYYVSGPWNIAEFRKRAPPGLEDAWGTMALPGPDGPGAGIAGGTSLVLFKSSAHQQQGWKLIEFLSRPDIQLRLHAALGDLPPRRSAWQSPALANDPYARAFGDQLERVKPTPKVLEWERIVQEMRLATERVVRGGQSQDKAVTDLDARVDGILAKRRWMQARASGSEP